MHNLYICKGQPLLFKGLLEPKTSNVDGKRRTMEVSDQSDAPSRLLALYPWWLCEHFDEEEGLPMDDQCSGFAVAISSRT